MDDLGRRDGRGLRPGELRWLEIKEGLSGEEEIKNGD
jgi:hypothetical protein